MLFWVRSGKAAYLSANDNFKYWSCKIPAAESKIEAARFTDNPGRPGKSQVRLVDLAPQKPERKFRRGRIHRFLWRRSHAAKKANEESGGEKRLETASS
jgi:hypothetical protein